MSSTLQIYRIVYRLTLCYLLLPLLLWSVFWLKPFWAIFFSGLLLTSGFLIWQQMGQAQLAENEQTSFSWKSYVIIVSPFLLLSCIAGIGGLGPQGSDWYKHNAILYDLSTRQWPVIYDDWNGDFAISRPYLCFYLSYYLPPTLLSKLFADSVMAANWLLLLWTQIALCLTAFWLIILSRSTKWWLGIAFCLVGSIEEWALRLIDLLHISRHVLRMQFHMPDTFNILSWAPHHGIALWLGVPFLLAHLFRTNWNFSWSTRIFWWAILFTWSPFVAIGAIPWLIFKNIALPTLNEQYFYSRRLDIFLSASAFTWILFQITYFTQRVPIFRAPRYFPENSFLPWEYVLFMKGWQIGLASFFFRYSLMVVFTWLIPCYCLWRWLSVRGENKGFTKGTDNHLIFDNGKKIILVSCGTVFFIGLFRVGIANDLYWRGILPSFMALFFLSFCLWNNSDMPRYSRAIALGCFIFLSAMGPIEEIISRTSQMVKEERLVYRAAVSKNISFANSEIQVNDQVRRQQYLGLPNSIFARYFLKDDRTFKTQAVTKADAQ